MRLHTLERARGMHEAVLVKVGSHLSMLHRCPGLHLCNKVVWQVRDVWNLLLEGKFLLWPVPAFSLASLTMAFLWTFYSFGVYCLTVFNQSIFAPARLVKDQKSRLGDKAYSKWSEEYLLPQQNRAPALLLFATWKLHLLCWKNDHSNSLELVAMEAWGQTPT